ncbi:hypothetical protein RYX36_021947 [Vicia faba]
MLELMISGYLKLVVSTEHHICFVVPEKEVRVISEALQSRLRQALDNGRTSQVAIIPNCSILAAIGQKLASPPGISATIFNVLAKPSINVRAIAQGYSEYNITIVVKREEKAADYRPRILICGDCSYPREWDYGRLLINKKLF